MISCSNDSFFKFLSKDFTENLQVLEIDRQNGSFSPSDVFFYEIFPEFKTHEIFGYYFTPVSKPLVSFEVNRDLYHAACTPKAIEDNRG